MPNWRSELCNPMLNSHRPAESNLNLRIFFLKMNLLIKLIETSIGKIV